MLNKYILPEMIKICARTKYTNGSNYDPTARPWYKDAVAKQGGIVVTERIRQKKWTYCRNNRKTNRR